MQLLSALFVPRQPNLSVLPLLPHPALPSPIRVNRLASLLQGYSTPAAHYLLQGFTKGFPLHFEGPRFSFFASNLKSVCNNPLAVDAKLSQEISLGRIAGPFAAPPFQPFRVSPLGLMPKKSPGEFRLIQHLSFPKGSSINDGISEDNRSVQYASPDNAIRQIKAVGSGCALAKTDIKKHIPYCAY